MKNYTLKPKNKHSKSINFENNIFDKNYDDMITKILKDKSSNFQGNYNNNNLIEE